ncbi:MAG: LamG-like jellyroll fold domain-containing protein [Verrucomicrobiales bacterium]
MKNLVRSLFLASALTSAPSISSIYGATFYSNTVANDDPILYWNFDEVEGGAVQQMPVAPAPVTSENDLVPSAGSSRISHTSIGSNLRLNNALDLKGTNFFRATNMRAGKPALNGAYAIEFWFQSQGENPATYLVNFGAPPSDNSPAIIHGFNENYLEIYGAAGGRSGTAGPTLSDQEWHHLALVYYGNGIEGVAARVDAYLDGVEYPYISEGFSRQLRLDQIVIGAALLNGADAFTGRIDEFAVYDLSELLDETAVQEKMSALTTEHFNLARDTNGASYSSAVIADEPILYWNFDEAEGNALQQIPISIDPLDNTLNDLQPTGNAVRVTHASVGSPLELGGAIELDGLSSFQKLGGIQAPELLVSAPWAMELWFQFTGDQANRYLLNMGAGGRNSPAIIYGYFGSRLEVFGNGRSSTNGVPVNDQNWHHLVVVNYGTAPGAVDPGANVNRVDFIIDNVQHENVGGGFNQPLDFRDWLIFGAATSDNSGGLIGRMDELAIYNLNGLVGVEQIEAEAIRLAASHYAAAFGSTSGGNITITSHPGQVTASIGQSASFTVAADVTGTTSPLLYQWLRNGVAISGATNATYAIEELSLYDVGTNVYTARVSAGAAFKISNPATLTVAEPPAYAPTPYSTQVKADQPILYWNFDEMTGVAKQQMNVAQKPVTTENNLSAVNAAAQRFVHADAGTGLDKLGNALMLDGFSFMQASGTRLSKSTIAGPWAVEFWVQYGGTPGTPANVYIANFGPPGADNHPAFIYGFNTDRLEVYGAGLGRSGANGPIVADNEWHHVLWVNYNTAAAGSDNRVEVYVDGVLHANAGGGFNRDMDVSSFIIGAATPAPADGFIGGIDEVAVYDWTGLSVDVIDSKAAAIAATHHSAARAAGGGSYSTVVLADQPILYYNFDEVEGPAQQKAPVTLPPLEVAKNDLVPTAAGRVQHSAISSGRFLGNAADFDGKAYFHTADLDAGPALPGPWAIEFWMQAQGVNDTERQSYLMNFGANAPAVIYDFKPDELELFAGVRTDLGPVVSDNEWRHVLWVFYGDGITGVSDRVDAYVDGVAYPYVRNTFTHPLNITGSLIVGAAMPGYNGFQGRIDELAVYDFSSLGSEEAIDAKVEQMVASHIAAAGSSPATLTASRNGNQLTLSWAVEGYTLQQSDTLGAGANWTPAPGDNDSPVQIQIPDSGMRFYRLVKQ